MTGFRYSDEEWSKVAALVADQGRLPDLRRFLETDVVTAAWRMAEDTESGAHEREHYRKLAKSLNSAVQKIDDAISECRNRILDHFSIDGTDFDDLVSMRQSISEMALQYDKQSNFKFFWGENKGGRHLPRRNYIIAMVLDAWCDVLGQQCPPSGGGPTSAVTLFVIHAANPILKFELGETEAIAVGEQKRSDGEKRFGSTGLREIIAGYAAVRAARDEVSDRSPESS